MAERMDPWSGRRASGAGGGEDEITFTNVRILDGTGERPYPGEVTVAGNRIRSITVRASAEQIASASPQTSRNFLFFRPRGAVLG